MKPLSLHVKKSLLKILVGKIREDIKDSNVIEKEDYECFFDVNQFNQFSFFPSVTVAYNWQQEGNEDETGPLPVKSITLVYVDYAEYRDATEAVHVCTPEEKKEIEVYLLANL